ncbi:MAG: hypothetical protein Q7J84_03360 [Sulfuricaulis sp.]|nr:hypothetical protein [Sulfuricaulis sp.]
MLRKTILILALPLSLSLPSWGAEDASVTSMLYEGASGTAATKQGEVKGGVAASLAQDRDADTSDAENVDCFYQEHANHPSCAKAPKARAADATHGLHQKARN